MKAVLVAVNAKYIHSNLAVYDLYAYAQKYRNNIEIAEYTINNLTEEIIMDIYRKKPDVLAFSVYIWNVAMVRETACELHKLLPDMHIWAGGPEVSYDAERFLTENPAFTGVMYGEGEETFRQLMKYYSETQMYSGEVLEDNWLHRGIEQLTGIVYNKRFFEDNIGSDVVGSDAIVRNSIVKNAIVRNAPTPYIDMNDIPFIYKDMDGFENRIIYYESSRGCPFSCSYCLSSVEKKLRFRDAETVKSELAFFMDKRVPQVKFVDRTFNCNKKHALEIWKFIRDNDNGITNFHFEVGADLIGDEELEVLSGMRSGLVQLEIGVQSTNDDTIREIRRVMDFGKLSETVSRIKSFGNIHQHLDLIAGLPYENFESFKKSFNDVYSLHSEQLQLGFLKVLKGSYMQEKQDDYGIVHTDTPPYEVMCTNWLSFDDVMKLKVIEEMVETFYNSGQFKKSIAWLEKQYDTPYELYEELGKYYLEHVKMGFKQSRMTKYELLYSMYADRHWSKAFGNLLVYDIFDRENAKSRPSFKVISEEEKKQIRDYYRGECREYDGKRTHIEPFDLDVDKMSDCGIIEEKHNYIMFDYDNDIKIQLSK